MNILFINDIPFNPALGGIERVTDILVKNLIKKGYNIYYLCDHTNNRNSLDYDFPAPMYTLPYTGLFEESRNWKYYINFINENNIDIVINQRGLEIKFEKSLEIEQVKKISVLHSMPNAYLNIYSKVFYKPKCLKDYLKNIVKFSIYPLLVLRNKNRVYKTLSAHFNYISDNSDAIVLLSRQYIDDFFSFKITNNVPVYSIPNPNTYPIHNITWEDKEKIVLFVGRLEVEDKNPIQLLKVWKKLHKKHSDWKLVFVGNGSELNRMQLFVYNNKLLNVHFVGNQKNVLEYYRAASFICLTSNFEGWAMSLTEGMCCGCIPFAFDSYKAVNDIIDNGINGVIIKSFNIKEYALKLSALMSNKELCKKMSKEAQIKVTKFEVNKIIPQWENIISSIMFKKNL